MKKLGVIDSGLGGALVVHELRKRMPKQDIIFLADQRHAPYGDKTQEQIIEYSIHLIEVLEAKGIEQVVIACNTICANAYDALVARFPHMHFISIIQPTIAQLSEQNKHVLVLATAATVHSHAYKKTMNELYPTIYVEEYAAKALVPLIEAEASSTQIKQALANIFKYIDASFYDALILGCTHYPLIKKEIKTFFKGQILDSHDAILACIQPSLGQGTLEVYTSLEPLHLKKQVKDFLKEEWNVQFFK